MIYARAGTYVTAGSEEDVSAAGTSGSHITFTNYPGDANPVFEGGVQSQYGVYLRMESGAAYIDFSNFTINCQADTTDYSTMSNTSPVACGYPLEANSGSGNITFTGVTFRGGRQQGIFTQGSPYTFNQITLTRNAWDNNASRPTGAGGPWRTTSGGGGGGWPSAFAAEGAVLTLENSTIADNDGEGILAGGTTATIQNNVFYDNFSTNAGCDGVSGTCTLSGNLFYTTQNSEYERYRFTGYAPAINIGHDTEGGRNGTVVTVNNIATGGWYNYSFFNSTNQTNCFSNYVTVGNTFVNPIGPGGSYQANVNVNNNGTSCSSPSGSYWQDNIAFINNSQPQTSNSGVGGVTYNHNDWYGGSGGAWAGGTGDITSNPNFAGTLGNGSDPTVYQLLSGSPAIGAGTSISTWASSDYGGNARPDSNGKYDDGAWNTLGR
jgi:hypothetical protein